MDRVPLLQRPREPTSSAEGHHPKATKPSHFSLPSRCHQTGLSERAPALCQVGVSLPSVPFPPLGVRLGQEARTALQPPHLESGDSPAAPMAWGRGARSECGGASSLLLASAWLCLGSSCLLQPHLSLFLPLLLPPFFLSRPLLPPSLSFLPSFCPSFCPPSSSVHPTHLSTKSGDGDTVPALGGLRSSGDRAGSQLPAQCLKCPTVWGLQVTCPCPLLAAHPPELPVPPRLCTEPEVWLARGMSGA